MCPCSVASLVTTTSPGVQAAMAGRGRLPGSTAGSTAGAAPVATWCYWCGRTETGLAFRVPHPLTLPPPSSPRRRRLCTLPHAFASICATGDRHGGSAAPMNLFSAAMLKVPTELLPTMCTAKSAGGAPTTCVPHTEVFAPLAMRAGSSFDHLARRI